MNLNERIEIKKDNFDEIRDEEILKLHLKNVKKTMSLTFLGIYIFFSLSGLMLLDETSKLLTINLTILILLILTIYIQFNNSFNIIKLKHEY